MSSVTRYRKAGKPHQDKLHNHGGDCCSAKVEVGLALADAQRRERKHDHGNDRSHDHKRDHQHDHGHGAGCSHRHDDAPARVQLGQGQGAKRSRLQIQAMDCPTEARLIEKALSGMNGVVALEFNFIERVLLLQHDLPNLDDVKRAIAKVGMQAVELSGGEQAAAPVVSTRRANLLLLASGLTAAASEVAAWTLGDGQYGVAALALASILLGGTATLKKGWIALSTRTLNIHFLMSVAVIGAMLIGQWPEAAMVLFLFAIAERLEAMSLSRAGEAVRALMALAPETAWVADGTGWREAQAAEVAVGSRVRVRPGERVPLDGRIVSGHSNFNEAPITGESLPVDKGPDDGVFAGSINGSGVIEIETTAAASGSVLARIIATVRDAQAAKAPTQRFIDRFAAGYTPVVLALAALFAVGAPLAGLLPWHQAIYSSLVMLVIACPCALVIATPVTVVSALASAARHGLLVKGGAPLEMAARIDTVCLDKTGTLTRGEPSITRVLPLAGDSEEIVLAWAAALDSHSTHPLARAVLDEAAKRGVAAPASEQVRELIGRGVSGLVDGRSMQLGSRRLAEEQGALSPQLEQTLQALDVAGEGALVLLSGDQALAVLAVADQVRPEAAATIDRLNRLGVRTVMLSGDSPQVVTAVARLTGVGAAHGGLLPQDKLRHIERLQQAGKVAMVGDGVNDAPALARADLGIAMGAAGSDSALETAGVALMDDKLSRLADLIVHARRTARVLKVNIAIALGIKLVFFGLALAGVASLWMAVFADVGTSLIVIGNGLRLARKVQA
ncbi:cadmium-translocating P-type ATPase [Chromobacterium phragmitis]|uniref:heavy metal translocating P-type ATPase n=1 Tax=Chromobacterium amazonense TaxID=1382803 RepID=UPI0021B83E9D|nr:heavy metal translocating P-type ATPase [Chromobacterium amazonense]MBM2883044.1 cadmium-translocating P-type ATPase [Chromobacterium amazonense]